jgi:CheY-like chemotaxis protein
VTELLIIDDEKLLKLSLEKILKSNGINAVFACSGEAAISLIESLNNLKLILLDLVMPGLNGFETFDVIRKNNLSTPIIAMSASATKNDTQKALDYGFNNLIVKPLGPKIIIDLFEKHSNIKEINPQKEKENIEKNEFKKHLSYWQKQLESQINQKDKNELYYCLHHIKENAIILKIPEIIFSIDSMQIDLNNNYIKGSKIIELNSFLKHFINSL